ncbi:MAG: monofunctional biosynthetic peptidoglycan transglycosylase, partial [Sphingopyxis sp.]|nr:monofunctional biosynthetic peptidoglycan transglycosylase [Sphingopyxis sp.]
MTTAAKKRVKRRKLPWYLRPFKWLLWFALISVLWVLIYAVVPPPVTFTMLADSNGITKDWTSLSAIDRNMVRAVIAAEDAKFCTHNGFDTEAIEQAIERNAKGKRMRGGSTVSQQTAKNVFLWQGSGWMRYVRKVPEVWFTFMIETIWGKRRIMEVYLNVAETGIGTYGVEAGAQRYFKHGAGKLT